MITYGHNTHHRPASAIQAPVFPPYLGETSVSESTEAADLDETDVQSHPAQQESIHPETQTNN